VLKELPAPAELCHQMIVIIVNVHFVEFDDIRMIHPFHDFELVF